MLAKIFAMYFML